MDRKFCANILKSHYPDCQSKIQGHIRNITLHNFSRVLAPKSCRGQVSQVDPSWPRLTRLQQELKPWVSLVLPSFLGKPG